MSENFLNGVLSEHAGKLTKLETINMDINNITVLCPEVRHWTNLKIFTISDNSLSGEYRLCAFLFVIVNHNIYTSQACHRSARRGAASTW